MKKRNGFTLIELLAVIVILAVIALIAVPKIVEILNKAKLSAAEDSTMGIIEAAESYVASFMLQNQGAIPSSDILFNCGSEGCKLFTYLDEYNIENLEELKFKGTKPTNGIVTISNNGKNVFATNLEINGFTCNYINSQVGCTTKDEIKYFQEAQIIYFNPVTGQQCTDYNDTNSDTENKTGCMKWYLYSENEKLGTVDMLLDHNTTATIAWHSQGNSKDASEINAKLREDTKSWQNNLNTRLITAGEIAKITKNEKFNSVDINTRFYFQDLTQNENATNECATSKNCTYAWLYDRTSNECENYGCSNNSNVITWGYWSSTIVTTNSFENVWAIDHGGHFSSYLASLGIGPGIRPVITISKSLISI